MSTSQISARTHRSRTVQIPASVQTLAERSTPVEIRFDIQKLLAQDQMELAQALGDAGLALHPESEDMVAICALLAMSRSDWVEAIELLQQLQAIQGANTPATTYWLMARCQRCMDMREACEATLEQGLSHFPQSPELQAEFSLLRKA